MKRSAVRGMSLAEMCVTLAIISLIAAALISFSVIVIREGRESTENLDTIREIRLAEELIEDKIEASGSRSGIEFDSTLRELKIGESVFVFSRLSEINIKELSENNDTLYICDIIYELDGETGLYTFCVSSYVGDILLGGNE